MLSLFHTNKYNKSKFTHLFKSFYVNLLYKIFTFFTVVLYILRSMALYSAGCSFEKKHFTLSSK